MATQFVTNNFLRLAALSYFSYNAESGTPATFKLMLMGASFTGSKNHEFVSGVVAHEVAGTGYTAGGNAVTLTVGNVTALNQVRVSCPGSNWPSSTLSVKAAVAYKVKSGPSTHEIVGEIIFDTLLSTTGTTFSVGTFEIPFSNLATNLP